VDYLDDMRAAIAAVGALRRTDVPEPVVEPLLEAFRALRDR